MDSYVAFAGSYDELTTDVPYGAFADFYEDIFNVNGLKPNSLIDLACGTGTLTEIMAGRGYDMTAVDSSPDMLAVAADKLSGLDNRPLLLCQRLEELDLYGTVDTAYCSLDAINYIPGSLLPEVFERVRLFLEPGGIFIFDINTPEKLRGLDGQIFIDETDDDFCVWRAEIDEDINACVYGMDLFQRRGELWERSNEEHIEYMHDLGDIKNMLSAAGLTDIRVYGNLRMEAPGPDEQRVFFTARKSVNI